MAVIVASTEIAVALPEETVTLAAPRSATIAKSPAISLVNAASADAQDQDPMIAEVAAAAAEVDSEVAVTSAEEVAVTSIATDAPDTAAAEVALTTEETTERDPTVVTESEQPLCR